MSRPLFTMCPKRANDLFLKGEISADDLHLMHVLVTEADHESREAVFPNLASLRSAVGWDRDRKATAQHLRNRLERLRERGEIAFEIQQGQRAPIVIAILKVDYFQTGTPSPLEVTSNGQNSESTQASDGRDFSGGELPTLEVTAGQTRPDIDREKDQSRDVPALVDQSLHPEDRDEAARTRAAELVALCRSGVEDNTLPVVTRYVRQMSPADVDEVEASFRNAIAMDEIHKSDAAWLVGALKKRALKAAA